MVERTAERLQGPWGRGEGGGKKGEKIPKARKAGREAGPGLETAAICSVALGLRWGWRSLPWRWSPPPRLVPSATRARPWTALPSLPGPHGPGGGWLGAPQPGQGAGWGATPAGGEVGGGGVRLGKHRARGAVCPRGGSRQWRGALGAGWARRIAKSCGLARVADLRGEGAGRRDLF